MSFLLGCALGYAVAHYGPARLQSLWAKFMALFGSTP